VVRRPGSRLSLLFELYAASGAARSLVAAAMVGSPLTPEEYAVYSVLFDEGPHAPTELARRTGMPATSMSHFVRRMLARGHAERAAAAEDRRSYRIVLTEAGVAAHEGAALLFEEADALFTERLAISDADARSALREIGRAARQAQRDLAVDHQEASA